MIKEAIGILDMGVEAFNVLETFAEHFKHEKIIYVNDLKHQPYHGRIDSEVIDLIKIKIDFMLKQNIKLLVVASDSIVDYANHYLETLPVPVINIVSTLIDYVNTFYEQKNLVLLAKDEIIDANIYQKNFKYNRLFNIPSNVLIDIITEKKTKTSYSFNTVHETLKNIVKKDIDVVITSSPFLINLKTEVLEYTSFMEMTDVGIILVDKIKEEIYDLNEKGKGQIFVFSNVSKKEFVKKTYWSNLKYKYIEIEEEIKTI